VWFDFNYLLLVENACEFSVLSIKLDISKSRKAKLFESFFIIVWYSPSKEGLFLWGFGSWVLGCSVIGFVVG
jgi:hypothetical protein